MLVLSYISILFLSVFVAFKGIVSFFILNKEVKNKKLAAALCIFLTFITPIVTVFNFPRIYLGQISPNVWHNPTIIFSMPFNILLFYFSIKSLTSFKQKDFIFVSLLIVVILYRLRPNYFKVENY